jgi:hypothetical protein
VRKLTAILAMAVALSAALAPHASALTGEVAIAFKSETFPLEN